MKTSMTITLLLFNTILFLTKCNIMIDAQLLHPLDLVIGQWGVKLHRKDVRLLESILFPPMLCSSLSSSKQDEGLQNSNSNRRKNYYNNNGNTLLKRRKRLLNCNLVLNGDGSTFHNTNTGIKIMPGKKLLYISYWNILTTNNSIASLKGTSSSQ